MIELYTSARATRESFEARLLSSETHETLVERLRSLPSSIPFALVQEVLSLHQERFLREMDRDASSLRCSRITHITFHSEDGSKRRLLCLEGVRHVRSQFLIKGPKIEGGLFKDLRRLLPLMPEDHRNRPFVLAKLRTVHAAEDQPEGRPLDAMEQPFSLDEVKSFFKEADVSHHLRKNTVPYVLKVWSANYRKKDGVSSRLLMEYCDGGELFSYLKRETDVMKRMTLAPQLVEGLLGIQRVGFCHGDLKYHNIMINHGSVRIGDFGTTRREGEPCLAMSTLPAPEMFCGFLEGRRAEAHVSADLWSLGDILYFLRFGKSLLGEMDLSCRGDPDAFLERARTVPAMCREKAGEFHDELTECIARLFSFEPEERPSLDEVLGVVREWLAGHHS